VHALLKGAGFRSAAENNLTTFKVQS